MLPYIYDVATSTLNLIQVLVRQYDKDVRHPMCSVLKFTNVNIIITIEEGGVINS